MVKAAIRGIPNFAYLQYEEFASIEDVFKKFSVKVRGLWENEPEWCLGNKRVSVFLHKSTPALEDFCKDFGVDASPESGVICRSGGGWRYDWQAIDGTKHPDWPALLAKFKAEKLKRQKEEEKAVARQEEIDNLLAEACNKASSRVGWEKVLQALKDLH